MRGLWLRIRALLLRQQLDRDLEDEIRFHLEMLEQDDPCARGRFGNMTYLKETSRELFVFGRLESLWQDTSYGARTLRKTPGFTIAAVLSLALGIGANTAIFSVLNAVMLRELPVAKPEQMVQLLIRRSNSGASSDFNYPTLEHMQAQTKTLAGLFAHAASSLRATINGRSEPVTAALVSANYHAVLGIEAAHGRTLVADDDKSDNTVAVISHRYWERRFGKDPAIVGRSIGLNGVAFTIVGVMPPEFFGVEVGSAPDVTVPLSLQPKLRGGESRLRRNLWWLQLLGRLKPDVTLAQAEAELTGLYQGFIGQGKLTPELREMLRQERIELASAARGMSDLRGQASSALVVLSGAVALVLLIACLNVANLLVARAMSRRREIAVRLALGAGRARLIRQFFLESLLLGLLGGGAGILFACWAPQALVSMAWKGPGTLDVSLDWRVLVFTSVLCLMSPLVFGLAPAWVASRFDPGAGLKEGPSRNGPHGVRLPLGRLLVGFQVALSLVLLIGAGLFGRSLKNLASQDLGFRRGHLLLGQMNPADAGFHGPKLKAFQGQLVERLAALPGVEAVSFSRMPPLHSERWHSGPYRIENAVRQRTEGETLELSLVGPGFFETIGMELIAGRSSTAQDHESAPRVAVVNQAFVRRYFGGESPIGKRLIRAESEVTEIVGVVKNAKYHHLREIDAAMVFVPYWQAKPSMQGPTAFEIRAAGDPRRLMNAVRQELAAISSEILVTNLQTIEMQIGDSLARDRLLAVLTGSFGVAALALAAVGLYGVVAYTVSRRTREIGIRMALGADRRSVVLLMLREVGLLVGLGTAAGIAGALASGRLVSTLLFGVSATDPLTLVLAAAVLALTALLAGWWPAREAARVDPMAALRQE